jgi:hypothetical protein
MLVAGCGLVSGKNERNINKIVSAHIFNSQMCIYGGCTLHGAQKTKRPGSHLMSLLHPASYHGSHKARSCRQDRKGLAL